MQALKSLSTKSDQTQQRQIWATNRLSMETENMLNKCYGGKGRYYWYLHLFMAKMLKSLLHLTGLYRKGVYNAKNIVLREIPLYLPQLPQAFEGFTILHLSDLHLDGIPGLEKRILNILDNRKVDLCVMTGDYRYELHGPIQNTIKSLEYLVKGIRSRHGILGVLGNHDDCQMVKAMEKMGIQMLINETHWVSQEDEKIQFIGTDDVNFYYTEQASHVLKQAHTGFSIALIHSPELYDIASQMEVDLYLCGHTHAGQICLPGGQPFTKRLSKGKPYYYGHWSYQGMQGITHAGVGVSMIPVRFNTQGEILILRLHRKTETE